MVRVHLDDVIDDGGVVVNSQTAGGCIVEQYPMDSWIMVFGEKWFPSACVIFFSIDVMVGQWVSKYSLMFITKAPRLFYCI